MKIIVCGNHNPHFFNSVECREKALREMGHDVFFFNTRAFRLSAIMRESVPWCQDWDIERNSRELVELVRRERPALCIVVGGNVSPQAIRAISDQGVLTALWTTDPPRYFQRVSRSALAYDRVFCSGTEAVEILQSLSVKSAPVWIPFACDPELHCPVELTNADRLRYTREVSFVGSYYPNRAKILEPLADFELGIWGPAWKRVGEGSRLWPFVQDCRVNYEEWRKIYAAAQIVIMTHFQDGRTPCYQASPKLFEAMACGAFVLCDDQRDARKLFKDGEHLVFFKDAADLCDKVRYYLGHDEERARIAAAGRSEVIAKHTYRHRCEALLAACGEIKHG